MSKFEDKDPQECADAEGLIMVIPSSGELFIDIDDDEPESQRARMEKGIETLRRNGSTVEIRKETISKNGNSHVYLMADVPGWDGNDPVARAALQACLGSDPVKELLSLLRVWNHKKRPPTTFFEMTEEQAALRAAIDQLDHEDA